ncbi:hypothetical protein QYB58_000257 [Clostridium perfringens]|nr:hypothetical protein [Clostridium perfringens]
MNIIYDINSIDRDSTSPKVNSYKIENVAINKVKEILQKNIKDFLDGEIILFNTIIQNLDQKVYLSLQKNLDEVYGIISNDWSIDETKEFKSVQFCNFSSDINKEFLNTLIATLNYILKNHFTLNEEVKIQNNNIEFINLED